MEYYECNNLKCNKKLTRDMFLDDGQDVLHKCMVCKHWDKGYRGFCKNNHDNKWLCSNCLKLIFDKKNTHTNCLTTFKEKLTKQKYVELVEKYNNKFNEIIDLN